MKNFKLAEPETIEQAVTLLAKEEGKAFLMAGGTDLLTEIKEGVIEPGVVVNLKPIRGLSYIRKEKDGLHIGTLTTVADLAADPLIRQEYPVLHEAANVVATPQLRNVGTVGGNLCQRPRCWYYRDGQVICRKKGGSQCFAFRGRNKYHAIIGGGICYIVYPSDLAPALISLGAEATVSSHQGERTIPLADFYALPQKDVKKENILGPGEIVREVRVPPARKGEKSIYLKFKERATWDFAVVSVAVKGEVSGQNYQDLKIVLGGVAPIPWRLEKAEAALIGKKTSEPSIREAAQLGLADARPLAENGYKKDLAEALLVRALSSLV